jgi:hypothetical protein
MTDRERIKVARDKFELEMKRDTKRPWDGSDLYRKNPSVRRRSKTLSRSLCVRSSNERPPAIWH